MNSIVTAQDNAQQIQRQLSALASFGLAVRREALAEIGNALAQSTRMRFNQGVSPEGVKWAPLAWATIVARARRGRSMKRGGKLVRGDGRYRKSFANDLAGGFGSAKPLMDTRTHLYQTVTYQVQRNALIVGVAPSWGGIHQRGGMAGRNRKVRIPARPFLGISLEDRRSISAILTRRLLAVATLSPVGVTA